VREGVTLNSASVTGRRERGVIAVCYSIFILFGDSVI